MKRRAALGAGASLALGAFARPGRADNADGGMCEAKASCERVHVFWGPNHGHVLTPSAVDARAAAKKTYDVRGKSDHGHTFTVTADDWTRLLSGEPVRLASSKTGGHLHRVLLRCAPAEDPPEWISACDVEIGGTDGHDLVVPAAHLQAKRARAYDIQGAAPHTHEVKISVEQFAKIAAGETVRLSTGAGDGHTHLVVLRLASK